jgi:hypothetical protein
MVTRYFLIQNKKGTVPLHFIWKIIGQQNQNKATTITDIQLLLFLRIHNQISIS